MFPAAPLRCSSSSLPAGQFPALAPSPLSARGTSPFPERPLPAVPPAGLPGSAEPGRGTVEPAGTGCVWPEQPRPPQASAGHPRRAGTAGGACNSAGAAGRAEVRGSARRAEPGAAGPRPGVPASPRRGTGWPGGLRRPAGGPAAQSPRDAAPAGTRGEQRGGCSGTCSVLGTPALE